MKNRSTSKNKLSASSFRSRLLKYIKDFNGLSTLHIIQCNEIWGDDWNINDSAYRCELTCRMLHRLMNEGLIEEIKNPSFYTYGIKRPAYYQYKLVK